MMPIRLLAKFRSRRTSECSSVASGFSAGSGTSVFSKQTAAETVVCSPRQRKVQFRMNADYDLDVEVRLFMIDELEYEDSFSISELEVKEEDAPKSAYTDADDFLEKEEALVDELKNVFEICSEAATDDSATNDLVSFMARWADSPGRGLETSLLNPTRLEKIQYHVKSILKLQADLSRGALKNGKNKANLLRKRSRSLSRSQTVFSYLLAIGDTLSHKEFEI